jgi:hypothetical protein
MQELTMCQMSETDGRIGFRSFWRGFFPGFLCGVSIVGVIVITPTPSVFARLSVYGAAIGNCGLAFTA